MQRVNVGHKNLADYASIVGRSLAEEIRTLAEPLRGKRMLHLSATAFGGGVAEIQYTLIPLLNDAGIETEWRVIQGRDEFFDVTKTIHNALQGNPQGLTAEQKDIFRRYNQMNAEALTDADEWDMIVVHDPQPAFMRGMVQTTRPKWVWRAHIDLSTPNMEVMDFLVPSISQYDAAIFHMHEYVPRGSELAQAVIWPPAIDPLAPKNMALAPEDAAYIVEQFGIDPARPMLLQVSRFDPWKDPLGVIDTYRAVKEQHPGLQLALVGSMAHDDPEGWEYYNQTVEAAGDDEDIHILSNLNNVGAVEVNAFQVHAAATLQKSIKEGFGLTVAEALWKARPVIGGKVGGIVTQIEDQVTGHLVSSSEEAAQRALQILADPVAAREMARRGKEHVRRRFLTPRLVRDWLALMHHLDGEQVELDLHKAAA
ncbi:MAG: trehalose synthase [Gaiellales bacterium]|nr:trehalose synthase [Gaiellales bacterium]